MLSLRLFIHNDMKLLSLMHDTSGDLNKIRNVLNWIEDDLKNGKLTEESFKPLKGTILSRVNNISGALDSFYENPEVSPVTQAE